MGHRIFLALLILGLLSGCVSKLQETQKPPLMLDDTADDVYELPDIEDVTEEELAPEPDLEINDTVDLGSLL